MNTEFKAATDNIDGRFAVIVFLLTCNSEQFAQYMQAMEAVQEQSSRYRYSLTGRGLIDIMSDDCKLEDILPAHMIAGPESFV